MSRILSLLLLLTLLSLTLATPLKLTNFKSSLSTLHGSNILLIVSEDAAYLEKMKTQWRDVQSSAPVQITSLQNSQIAPIVPIPSILASHPHLATIATKLERVALVRDVVAQEKQPVLVLVDVSGEVQYDTLGTSAQKHALKTWILSEIKEVLGELDVKYQIKAHFEIILDVEDALQEGLQGPGVQLTGIAGQRTLLNTKVQADSFTTPYYPQDWERADYQMVIWSSVVVVILIALGYWFMHSIDYTKDAMLYAAGEHM